MPIHTIIHSDADQIKKTYKPHNNTQNNTNKACKVTKHGKLALFAQYCYIEGGRNGRDHPDIEILIQKLSSRGAGDQRANPIFSRLTTPFGRAALVTTAIMAMPLAACAQDNTAPDISTTSQPVATFIVADAGDVIPPVFSVDADGKARVYNAASTSPAQNASINPDADTMTFGPMTPKEVREFSKNYDAVIYHGNNILDADTLAEVIREDDGYNVVSVSGFGRADTAMIVIKDKPILKFYTQRDLNRGVLGAKITKELGIKQTASFIPAGLD